jgi:hypothetical protein
LGALLCAPVWAIDFHAPGEGLGRAVERLAAQTGRKLYVASSLKDEVVVVHATDVGLEDLLARIADVANAEWRTSASGSVLERTPVKERELREQSLARRSRLVTEYLAKFEKDLAAPFTADDAIAIANGIVERAKANDLSPMSPEQRALWEKGPAARLAHRLLLTLDAESLVDVPFGGRRVFGLKPTKLQYALGKGADEAFEQYVAEQNVWAASTSAFTNPEQLNIVTNPLTRRSAVADVRTDFLLEVKRTEMDTPLFCNLLLPSPDGRPSVVYQVIVPSARNSGVWQALGTVTEVPDVPRLMRTVLRELHNFAIEPGEPPTQDDLALLYDPSKYDLAGALAESVFAEYYRDKDLVALLGDNGAMVTPYLFGARGSIERFERYLPDLCDATLWHDGAWTLVEPSDPHRETLTRTPRTELRNLLLAARKTGSASFDDLAAFNAKLMEPSAVAMAHLMVLGVTGWQQMGGTGFWHVSRLYGALSPSQRRLLADGGGVRFGDLAPHAQRLFEALTTSSEIQGIEPINPNTARLVGRRGEPTLLLVDGVPRDATFSLDLKSEASVITYAMRAGSFTVQHATTAESVAYQEKMRASGDTRGRLPDAYAMGATRTYHFKIVYASDLSQSFIVTCPVPDPEAKPGKWTDLPPDIVERVRKAMGG